MGSKFGLKARDGYQPEKKIMDGVVPPNTEEKPRVNDVCDIIGYCTLLLVSMGVTAEDIAKFKD